MAPDIRCQLRRARVAPLALLFERMEDDAVEIAADRAGQRPRIGAARAGDRNRAAAERLQPRARGGRVLLPQHAHRLVEAGTAQRRDIERPGSGEQFVEQDSQRIDVAARVDVLPAPVELLRRHAVERADQLAELVSSASGLSGAPRALAMPKSMIFGAGRPFSTATRTLADLRSRWMIPFWCAC